MQPLRLIEVPASEVETTGSFEFLLCQLPAQRNGNVDTRLLRQFLNEPARHELGYVPVVITPELAIPGSELPAFLDLFCKHCGKNAIAVFGLRFMNVAETHALVKKLDVSQVLPDGELNQVLARNTAERLVNSTLFALLDGAGRLQCYLQPKLEPSRLEAKSDEPQHPLSSDYVYLFRTKQTNIVGLTCSDMFAPPSSVNARPIDVLEYRHVRYASRLKQPALHVLINNEQNPEPDHQGMWAAIRRLYSCRDLAEPVVTVQVNAIYRGANPGGRSRVLLPTSRHRVTEMEASVSRIALVDADVTGFQLETGRGVLGVKLQNMGVRSELGHQHQVRLARRPAQPFAISAVIPRKQVQPAVFGAVDDFARHELWLGHYDSALEWLEYERQQIRDNILARNPKPAEAVRLASLSHLEAVTMRMRGRYQRARDAEQAALDVCPRTRVGSVVKGKQIDVDQLEVFLLQCRIRAGRAFLCTWLEDGDARTAVDELSRLRSDLEDAISLVTTCRKSAQERDRVAQILTCDSTLERLNVTVADVLRHRSRLLLSRGAITEAQRDCDDAIERLGWRHATEAAYAQLARADILRSCNELPDAERIYWEVERVASFQQYGQLRARALRGVILVRDIHLHDAALDPNGYTEVATRLKHELAACKSISRTVEYVEGLHTCAVLVAAAQLESDPADAMTSFQRLSRDHGLSLVDRAHTAFGLAEGLRLLSSPVEEVSHAYREALHSYETMDMRWGIRRCTRTLAFLGQKLDLDELDPESVDDHGASRREIQKLEDCLKRQRRTMWNPP